MREDTKIHVSERGVFRHQRGAYCTETRDSSMFLRRVAGRVGGFRLASWSYFTIGRQWGVSQSRANQAVKKYGRNLGLPWHWDDADYGVPPDRLRRIVKLLLAEERI